MNNSDHRIPPSRTPENDSDYSFPAHGTDISFWVMPTNLALHYQSTAITMRLGGRARKLARMMSPQDIVSGVWRDGQLLDPVTYLLGILQLRLANLEEKPRPQSMTVDSPEVLQFLLDQKLQDHCYVGHIAVNYRGSDRPGKDRLQKWLQQLSFLDQNAGARQEA